MKKSVGTSVFLALLMAGMMSCKKTEAPKSVEGSVFDATMNNIMLINGSNDTIDISTMNTDPQKVPGVLIGDSVKIFYSEKDMDGMKVLTADSLAILVHSPYYYIQGTWVEPNPINPEEVQGFTLNADGTAESVNMATLVFKSWNLDNRTLTLSSESIGNRQTISSVDTLQVTKINADSLILSKNNRVVWNMARKK